MEMLDVVDADDRVIGTASRDEVHQRRLSHRSSHVLLFNSNGALFVQRRGWHKSVHAGLWDVSVAGHVDAGESYLEAAVRECREEVGLHLQADDLEPLWRLEPSIDNGYEFQQLYRTVSDAPLLLEPVEIVDGRWLSPDAMNRWLAEPDHGCTPGLVAAWAKLGV